MRDALKQKIVKQRWDRIEKEYSEIVEVGTIEKNEKTGKDEMVFGAMAYLPTLTRPGNEKENKQRARDAHVPIEVR
jgi:hypothetical protein